MERNTIKGVPLMLVHVEDAMAFMLLTHVVNKGHQSKYKLIRTGNLLKNLRDFHKATIKIQYQLLSNSNHRTSFKVKSYRKLMNSMELSTI
jgi:hypothetical protein